jgi:hypothetical protein
MHCKLCNTRISPGEKACPNCGADVRGVSGSHPAPAPRRIATRLPPSPLTGGAREAELEADEPSGQKPASSAGARPAAGAPPGAGPTAGTPPGAAPMGPAGLRALLADQPELLEPGLRVYRDEAGAPAGVAYATGVGEIDLLATDARGNLVAVMVAEKGRGEEDLVAEVLQRIGWLRKHLCDARQQVRAIVLVEEPPASLPYAAAAVADTVLFKTFRVALVFEDVEI